MKLCQKLGLKNGLNTYGDLVRLIEGEVRNPQLNKVRWGDLFLWRSYSWWIKFWHSKETENKLIVKYLEKAKKATADSSFYGETGKTNLVATLGDIFMGGEREWRWKYESDKSLWPHPHLKDSRSGSGIVFDEITSFSRGREWYKVLLQKMWGQTRLRKVPNVKQPLHSPLFACFWVLVTLWVKRDQ